MMKFSALNESSLSDDNGDPELATREAQEEESYAIYHSALKKQYEGNLEESEEMFKDLLEMEFLTQAQPKEEKTAGPLGPALTLKYLVYKNLATISREKGDYHASVSFYLEALEIDSSDVMMWYNMGKASLGISNYSLARLCFEEGLKCNPNHWPCLDNVITVMYTLNDYANCLYYIAQALEKECYYLKGLVIKDKIFKEDPSLISFCESYFKKCDSSIHFAEYDKEEADKLIQECMDMREKKRSFYAPKPLPVLALGYPIKEYTWKNLGDSFINVYDCIANADPCVSFSCKIDLSPYLENKMAPELNSERMAAPSPISSLSEAFSSNSAPPSLAAQQNGPMQFTPGSQDPNLSEMEVDEANSVCQPNGAPHTLLLPQADIQPTDLSVYSDSTSSTKRTKRKRNEFAQLSDFVSKRRSTRVRNPAIKRPQDNTNYQELLHKFLPQRLIGDGRFDEQDYDSDHLSQDKSSCDHTYGQATERDKKDSSNPPNSSDLCSTEKEEVCDFIAKNQANGGVIDLLYKYVVILGTKSNLTWPKVMIDVFCSTFSRLRKHITVPNLFSHRTETLRIKELAWAFLVYCEFKVDQWYQNTGNSMPFSLRTSSNNSSFPTDKVGDNFYSDMEFLVQLVSRYDVFEEDWLNFSARALWLKAKFHSLEGEIDLAVCCMRKLYDVLSDDECKHKKITVQNCNVSSVIFSGNVKQQLESLQRCQSLEEVQRLYEHGDYAAVVDLLKLTFNQPRTSRKQSLDGVPERHAQLLLLQNSLMKLERYKECVLWSEVSFNEALQQFMDATKNAEWSETMAQLLSGLDKCSKLDSSYLSELDESKLVRLTQNLVLIIVIQMENYDFAGDNAALLVVLPWIILYRLILNEEKRAKDKSSENSSEKGSGTETPNNKTVGSTFLADFDLCASMPSSLMLLFTAHECLGRRSWCTACDGLLLLTFIDIMMAELQDTNGKAFLYREDMETGLEQCIYCLYGHPNKRSRAKHLQEHNAKQITLTWERAVLIFQYFKPNILPEFDSYRTSTISAELENLFRKISVLVPSDEDPTAQVDGYTAYIEGGTDKCPDPPFHNKNLSIVVKDLYYLLGDYYFKNKEFGKAIRFYLCDICINPDRQDSWAGMALSRSSQLDQKLNSYELRNESTIYRKASSALRCFEHALDLDTTTTSLWIEYGSLAYILHSHASRQLKQETFCDEVYDMLKKKKREMVEVAERCFRAANHVEDGGEPEEAWLHHYMLGKISEKEGEGPFVYLDHYKKALAYLHEDFARYPQKILYHNPAELSIEALEVYYRVHASCLKFLWKNEAGGLDLATVKIIQECLLTVKTSPFYNFQEKSKTEIIGSSSNAASETEELAMPKSVESESRVDHNYSENVSKNVKKISEDTRHSRPSTDSLPESQDIIVINEIMNSLVSVVAERFLDEEKEKAHSQDTVCNATEANKAECMQSPTKVIVESLAEESVYTTKLGPDQPCKASETDEISEVISPVEEPMVCDDMNELSKLQELAKELESKAAACESKKVDSVKENDSIEIATVKELPASLENNKDEEVLKSLSSILSSLEAVKNVDSNATEQKSAEVEICSTTVEDSCVQDKDADGDVIMQEDMEVSTTVPYNSAEKSEMKDATDESDCIQSMEVSTSDMVIDTSDVPVENEPQMMELDEKNKQEQQNDENITLESKKDPDSVLEAKQLSDQNKDNAVVVSSDGNLQPSHDEKNCDKSENVSANPSPSAEELQKSKAEITKLIPKCLDAMRECLQRFPQHYKALYRMAHYYCHSSTSKNLQWAREILLAATPATKKYPSMSGLFAERKNTNFFNGIWRAPSNEIDRPGSFGAHMYRSVHLLIDVLTQQKDYNMLVNLTLQLHRTPDLGKKYMRDTDRQFLVRKAYDACVNILRDQMNTLLQEEPPPEESRLICCLLEIYRTWMTLIKASINIDDSNELLEEAYTMYRMGEVDFQPSVLEQAKNFCQIQLGKTYPERTRRDIAMLEEHALQPLYSQLDSSKAGPSSKYATMPDVSSSHISAPIPSASAYNPDAWQKELAESLMMPVLPCEGRVGANDSKSSKATENKPPQDPPPLVLVPMDAFNSDPQTPPGGASQNPAASPPQQQQMVHVEKPKAENLQACSVAFLPVTPVFPKENVNTSPSVFQAPPLLSCQAFECFDVLTSIMQASGYQVAAPPQLGATPTQPPFDPGNAFNFKNQQQGSATQGGGMYDGFPPKPPSVRAGRKRRRGKSSHHHHHHQKMEGLNLSKKMHTKPIVSATIANSIAQLKIDPVIVTSDKRPQAEPTQSSPLCLVKPKGSGSKRVPCYNKTTAGSSSTACPPKGLDLSKRGAPETVTSTQCSVIVSAASSATPSGQGLQSDLLRDRESATVAPPGAPRRREPKRTRRKEKVADMLPDIYDFTDDSNLSANLETARIEKCAKEMLEFMNRRVEDAGGEGDVGTTSASKGDADNPLRLPETEVQKDSRKKGGRPDKAEDNNNGSLEEAGSVETAAGESTVKNEDANAVGTGKESSADVCSEENLNQLSKDSTTEFTLFSSKLDDDEDVREKAAAATQNLYDRKTPESRNDENARPGYDIGDAAGTGNEGADRDLDVPDDLREVDGDEATGSKRENLGGDNGELEKEEEEEEGTKEEGMDVAEANIAQNESANVAKVENHGGDDDDDDEQAELTDEDSSNLRYEENTAGEVDCPVISESDVPAGNEMVTEEEGGCNNSDTIPDKCTPPGRESGNPEEDSDEISMPKLEAAEPRPECSGSGQCNVIQFGNNETKNINYSILKKDCVVVIRLKDEKVQMKNYGGDGKFRESDDED